ncbi:MAG: patatin-like phospholipase family protein [candidate division KSB1 bacterium]|nr:patatin-like phospholipase family protein [candidate division KSB1 bacterium]
MQQDKKKTLLVVLLGLLLSNSIAAPRPKIGLALSSGGAKGFAHIGVLKVLEEIGMPIDYLAGTSMGSVVGALYAIGYKSAALEELALHQDWQDLFSDAATRRDLPMEEKLWDGRYIAAFPIRKHAVQLPAGLIAGQKITAMLSRLTWPAHHISDFKELPIPFVCVATDLETGEAVTLDSGFLPQALRASMAIPTIFTPVKLNNRLLVDGGLVRNLPVEDVRLLGADIVIAVDVGASLSPAERLNSFLSIIDQSVSFQGAATNRKQRQLCDILITPDITGVNVASFDQADTLIKRGEVAARRLLPQLRALADSLKRFSTRQFEVIMPKVDSIYIYDLAIAGLHDVSRRVVLSELDLDLPVWITAKQLEKAIDRVYGSQFFERVTYKLESSDKGTKLIVEVLEKTADIFRFGLRYDSHSQAALLLNTTFRNRAEHGSKLVLDLKLGDQLQIDAQYFLHLGLRPRLGFRGRVYHSRASIEIYQQRQRIASLRMRTTSAEALFGSIFSNALVSGLGLKEEFYHFSPDVASPIFAEKSQNFFSLFGLIWIDTLDRAVFTSSGHSLFLKSEVGYKKIDGDLKFLHHYFDWQGFFPLHPKLSLLTRVQLGSAPKRGLPLHYQFFLGGVDSFVGLKPQELAGKNVQALQLGLQYEILPRRFMLLRWNIGNTFDQWRVKFNRQRFVTGAGLTVGAPTLIGPIELTVMGGSRHRFLAHLNIGYKF